MFTEMSLTYFFLYCGRQVLVEVITHHPFDIAVYGNFLFWTDWVLHAVLRVNKFTGEDVVVLRKDVRRPMAIIAVANDTNECKVKGFIETFNTCFL